MENIQFSWNPQIGTKSDRHGRHVHIPPLAHILVLNEHISVGLRHYLSYLCGTWSVFSFIFPHIIAAFVYVFYK